MNPLRVGIDLGGTKTEIAVLANDNSFLFRHRLPTPRQCYADILSCVERLSLLAEEACQVPEGTPIGIGIPGCIDPQTQLVRGANTSVLNGKPLQLDLVDRLKRPVLVENDANCLALSESADGMAAQSDMVFAVILGTGCGGGIALSGRLWKGRNRLTGEWGHNPLPWPSMEELKTKPCWCGQIGCIETWLSGPGFAKDHQTQTGQGASPESIIQWMRDGHLPALESFERYRDRLARALAQVVNLLDPEIIVLGGGMSKVSEIYTNLPRLMERHTFTRPITTPVVQALHGDSSGVRGAAWLGENHPSQSPSTQVRDPQPQGIADDTQ